MTQNKKILYKLMKGVLHAFKLMFLIIVLIKNKKRNNNKWKLYYRNK